MMMFAVKVRIILHNLVFLEMVCYVFFYVGFDPSVLLLLSLIYKRIFRLFSCTGTSQEKYFEFGESLVILPTNGT